MTQKHNRDDHAFFVKCKKKLSARGARIEDLLFPRNPSGHQTRGLRISPPERAQGRALFVHGTGNDLTYPATQIYQHLFLSGMDTWAFDLDGHGLQSTSLFGKDTIGSFVPWAIDTMNTWVKPENNTSEKVWIIGHSLGGSLALDYAIRRPERVAGLILISAPVQLSADAAGLAAESLSVFRKCVWAAVSEYGLTGILPALGNFKRATYPMRLRDRRESYVVQVNELINSLQLDHRAHSISCPVLLIYGTMDHLVKTNNADFLEKIIPDSSKILVAGATHFSTILEAKALGQIGDFLGHHAK